MKLLQNRSFVAKKINFIIGIVGQCFNNYSYLAYQKFIAEPKQVEAANEMFVAQQNFQQATDGVE
jgi:hypothetical protein